jgi:uncharacterized Zn finger protein (UPF0148 family)
LQRLNTLLVNIADDRAEVFYRLFECTQGKKREERFEQFTKSIFPRIYSSGPKTATILCVLIEQLQQNAALFQKFRDPPLPLILSRVKGSKPIYKNLYMHWSGFEFQPNTKERKSRVIGSVISCVDNSPPDGPISILVDKTELPPIRFGEDTPYYHLSSNRSAHNFFVQFGGQIPKEALLKWLVIQFVDMKRPQDIVRDLLQENRIEPHPERPFLARTPQCRGCTFPVHQVVETIMNTGQAACPTCGANVALRELQFDQQNVEEEPEVPMEEEREMQEARAFLAEHLLTLMNPSRTELNWESLLFEEEGLKIEEYEPITYSNTKEFITELQKLAAGD